MVVIVVIAIVVDFVVFVVFVRLVAGLVTLLEGMSVGRLEGL